MSGGLDRRLARLVAFYATLAPSTLPSLDSIYDDDVRFIDPFNDVTGVVALRRIFEHMFAAVDAPRFDIVDAMSDGDRAFVLWTFRYRSKGRAATASIHGVSHLRFGMDGRVAFHRDYWDPARDAYEGVPVLGALMRWLRRRGAAPQPPHARAASPSR